jgi:hypothetical protein
MPVENCVKTSVVFATMDGETIDQRGMGEMPGEVRGNDRRCKLADSWRLHAAARGP